MSLIVVGVIAMALRLIHDCYTVDDIRPALLYGP